MWKRRTAQSDSKCRKGGKNKLGTSESQSARPVPDWGCGLQRLSCHASDWPWRLVKNLSPLAAEQSSEAAGPFKASCGQKWEQRGREKGSPAPAT